jgi:hypothetical protein
MRPWASKNKPRKKSKPKVDSAAILKRFHAEIERRTEIVVAERAKIKKPTKRMTKAEREHMHQYAFTAEQVMAEIRP